MNAGRSAPHVSGAGFVHVGFSRLSMIVHSPGRRDVPRGGRGDVIRLLELEPVVEEELVRRPIHHDRLADLRVRNPGLDCPDREANRSDVLIEGGLQSPRPDVRAEGMSGPRVHERHLAVDDAHRCVAGGLLHVGGDVRHQIGDARASARERQIDGDVDGLFTEPMPHPGHESHGLRRLERLIHRRRDVCRLTELFRRGLPRRRARPERSGSA